MDIKELNKSQLILLALLISFVTSIATGISTVTLMQQAPSSVTTPITRIVKQTIEKIVPADNKEALSQDQQQLLENLKAIQPLTVSLFLKGDKDKKIEDKILGTGLFLGNDKVIIASVISEPKDGEVYVVKSVLGEQKISKLTVDKDFTVVELSPVDTASTSGSGNTDTNTIIPAVVQ
ncbi:MAG: hypothetical protein NTZ44_01635 [Candidatus Nomurabacteria bacterium]|nr:hypothetical protein [Candidatus Nomurabacteria bacterium]